MPTPLDANSSGTAHDQSDYSLWLRHSDFVIWPLPATSNGDSIRVDVVDAHYLTHHPCSAVDWSPSCLALQLGMGLLSRWRITGPDNPDIAPLAGLT